MSNSLNCSSVKPPEKLAFERSFVKLTTLTNLTDLKVLKEFILTDSQGLEALSFPPNLT